MRLWMAVSPCGTLVCVGKIVLDNNNDPNNAKSDSVEVTNSKSEDVEVGIVHVLPRRY
jgi:hypothetical protein